MVVRRLFLAVSMLVAGSAIGPNIVRSASAAPAALQTAAPTPPASAGPPVAGRATPLPAGGGDGGGRESVPDRKVDPKVLDKSPVVQSAVTAAHLNLTYSTGSASPWQVAVRRAVAYGYCGINTNNNCGQPLLPVSSSVSLGTGTATLPVTSTLQAFWAAGQANIVIDVSAMGDSSNRGVVRFARNPAIS